MTVGYMETRLSATIMEFARTPGHMVCLSWKRHRFALTQKAWEDAVQELGKGCFTYLQAPVNLFLEERAEQEETRDRGTTVGSYNKHRPFFLPVNRPSSQTNYGEHDR